MVTTVRSVAAGVAPSPTTWANNDVKPAIEELQAAISSAAGDVQFSVARTGTSVNLSAGAYVTYPLDGTPTVNIGGGSWNSGTFVYTIPKTGLYLCLGSIRIAQDALYRSLGMGIGVTNANGPHMLWIPFGGYKRASQQYTWMQRFTTGDQVRMYIYSEGQSFDTYWDPSSGATAQFMSLIKLAD
jgi:hypothetical protein